MRLLTEPNSLSSSTRNHEWLGHGFYVWENHIERALDWAKNLTLFKTNERRQLCNPYYEKCPRKFIRGHLSHLDIGEKKILLHINFPHLHTARSLDAHKEDALA